MCRLRGIRPRAVAFAHAVRSRLTNAPESIQCCAKFHPATALRAFGLMATQTRQCPKPDREEWPVRRHACDETLSSFKAYQSFNQHGPLLDGKQSPRPLASRVARTVGLSGPAR